MRLEIYAGKNKLMELVEYITTDPITQGLGVLKKGHYAIPGGHVASEESVRTWARDYGYSIKQKYEPGDLRDETLRNN